MKNLFLLMAVLFLISCGGSTQEDAKSEENKQIEATTEQNDDASEKTKVTGEGESCEEFLDDYENYVNELLEVYKKIKENPTDMKSAEKMMEATTKMAKWSEKWDALHECADNEEYNERMEELQAKVDKVVNEE